MVRKLPLLLVALALIGGASYVVASTMLDTGPDPSKTGAPGVGGAPEEFNCTECHYVFENPNNLNAGNGYVRILDLPDTYVAGQTYPLRVELDCDSTRADLLRRWGFQLTAFKSSDGQGAGTFIIAATGDSLTDSLQIVTGFSTDPWASRNYVEHHEVGTKTGFDGPVYWSFQWQAPATPSGTIYFAAAGNATNGNDNSDGDWIFTTLDSMIDLTTPTKPVSWGQIKAKYRQ